LRGAKRWILPLFVLLATGFLVRSLLVTRVDPLTAEMARATVSDLASNVINEAVDQQISEGQMSYGQLVQLERNQNGEVQALRTDMQTMNRLKTGLLKRLDQKLEALKQEDIRIPAGNLTGLSILSDRGPGIPVRILSITNSGAEFSSVFQAAGINQTRHRIMLTVSLELMILLPTGRITEEVQSDLCVAETILLGHVPQSYSDFSSGSSGIYIPAE